MLFSLHILFLFEVHGSASLFFAPVCICCYSCAEWHTSKNSVNNIASLCWKCH